MTTTFALFIVLLAYCNAKAYGNRDETIRKNFHGLFDSVAANNSTSVDFFKKSLTNELDQESQEENHARRVTTVHFANDSLTIERRSILESRAQLFEEETTALSLIAKRKEKGELESYYHDELVSCKVDNTLLKQKYGAIETEKETNVLWLIRVRSAIEFFEDEYYQGDFTKAEWGKIKKLKGRERSRLVRTLKFRWIFTNKNTDAEPAVQDLVRRIKLNEHVKTTDTFSNLIALAYSDLSASIHSYVMLPGGGNLDVELSTRYPRVNEAVELFWKTFEFGDYIVKPAEFTSSPAASSSTPATSDSTPQPPKPATE